MREDRRKRIARLHALRDRVAEWAAHAFPAEMEAGMRCWLGPLDPQEDLISQAVAFALLAPADGPSLLERYEPLVASLPRADRRVFEAWNSAWFSVFDVTAVWPGIGLRVRDALTGRETDLVEESASWSIREGDWLAAYLIAIDGGFELEGSTLALAGGAPIAAVQALQAAIAESGLDPAAVDRLTSRRLARQVVDAARRTQARPRFVNHDGDDVELITATLGRAWAEVEAAVAPWDDVVAARQSYTFLGRHVADLVGPVVLAELHHDDDRVTLHVNSRGRLEGVCALWQERTGSPLPILDEVVESVQSNPDGPEVLVDSSFQGAAREGSEAEYQARLAIHWLDLPIPALGGLTPREAVAAGRKVEVHALLPTALPPEAIRTLRQELAL